jgi:hypothetical protein
MMLSAVVQLIDGFNNAPAVGIDPLFLLDGEPYRPIAKPQAFYAFSELADGDYRLTTISVPFFTQQVALKVPLQMPLAEAIVPCLLEPSPVYPYPAGTTMIRGLVRDAGTHQPLAGVAVAASYRNWRGEARQAATQTSDFGNYDGRYALALRGRLPPETDVTLTFSKTGYTTASKQVTQQAAATQFVDMDMR